MNQNVWIRMCESEWLWQCWLKIDKPDTTDWENLICMARFCLNQKNQSVGGIPKANPKTDFGWLVWLAAKFKSSPHQCVCSRKMSLPRSNRLSRSNHNHTHARDCNDRTQLWENIPRKRFSSRDKLNWNLNIKTMMNTNKANEAGGKREKFTI